MSGRVALVTGAGRGIEREIAVGLAERGARVALIARSGDELDAVAADIGARGGTAASILVNNAAMRSAGCGRIANVSSGIVARPQMMIGGGVYAAGKAALEGHSLNLAAELDDTGVTVNAYRPATVDTAMQAWIRSQPPEDIGAALHDQFTASPESGALITPKRSAAALLERLAGDETGQIWDVADATP